LTPRHGDGTGEDAGTRDIDIDIETAEEIHEVAEWCIETSTEESPIMDPHFIQWQPEQQQQQQVTEPSHL